jgi:nucleoside-diphosphate-sugar epimerase
MPTSDDFLAPYATAHAADRRDVRILITGGSGFIGTNLVELYRRAGVDALANLDIASPRNPAHRSHHVAVDLEDADSTRDAVAAFRPDVVFHLGARTDMHGRAVDDYGANTFGSSNLIAAMQALPSPPKAILASSRLVAHIDHRPVGEDDYAPTTPYGESKVEMERRVRAEADGLEWLLVRPTSIWGPWFATPYRDFFEAVARGRYVHPKGAIVRKSYGFVGNVVVSLDRLMFEGGLERLRHRTIYLADYPPIDVMAWAREISTRVGRSAPRTVPIGALRVGAVAGDVAKRLGVKEPPLTSFRLHNLVAEMVYDTAPLEGVVGSLPFTMPEGVEITVDWLRRNGDVAS